MKTLQDVLIHGNTAEAAGSPITDNWPQVRGAFLLVGRAFDLAGISLDGASDLLPAHPENLPRNVRNRFVSHQTYRAARREIFRLLALCGTAADPWDAIWAFIRRAGRNDIENALYHLRAPARNAGLVPAQITSDWFNRLDEAAVGQARQSLRAGAVAFNKLFDLPAIVASGLLPPEPVGPFPSYDRLGRRLHEPPPLLRQLQKLDRAGPTPIARIWQAIQVSGQFDLPPDPGLEDLLEEAVWKRIEGLEGALIGVSDQTLHIYKRHLPHGLEQARHVSTAATVKPGKATRPAS